MSLYIERYKSYLEWIRLNDEYRQTSLSRDNYEMWEYWYSEDGAGHKKFFDTPEKMNAFYGVSSIEELRGLITRYKYFDEFIKLKSKFDNKIEELDINIQYPKPKFKPNDKGIGMFSFDRASSGLYVVLDYFYEDTGEKLDDSNYVSVANKQTPDKYFFDSRNGRKLIQKKRMGDNGRPVVRTRTKKVYLYREVIDRFEKRVEFFIVPGGNAGISPQNLMYVGMAPILLAEKLESLGIRVRVNICLGGLDPYSEGQDILCEIFPVKDYGLNVDLNMLSLLASDPRIFRWKILEAFPNMYNKKGKTINEGYGSALTEKSQFIRVLNRLKQQEIDEHKKMGSFDPERVDIYKAKYIFGGTYSLEEAVKEYAITVHNINRIFSELFKAKNVA